MKGKTTQRYKKNERQMAEHDDFRNNEKHGKNEALHASIEAIHAEIKTICFDTKTE